MNYCSTPYIQTTVVSVLKEMFRTSYYQSELVVTKMKTMKKRVGQVY